MTTDPAYVPGVCNINYAEIAQRRRLGHLGLVVFIIVLAGLLVVGADRYTRIVLFLPALMAASGYLQARNHFCVGYAATGKQNASEGSTVALGVIEEAARKADKRRALRMNLQSFGIALGITFISVLLPQVQ